ELDTDQAKVALLRVPDRPGIAAQLFGEISQQNVDVDLIIQSIHEGNSNDIAFTVVNAVLNQAEAVSEAIAPALRSQMGTSHNEAEVMVERGIAKITISGAGMIGRPGIAAKMFTALAEAGVNIEMISTSEVKVSCIIHQEDSDRAATALCRAFEINSSAIRQTQPRKAKGQLVPVRGVALDVNQARLAIRHIPDQPGMAAKVFSLLAKENISVDMIIQSQRCRIINGVACRDIACTVAQGDAQTAQKTLQAVAKELQCGEILVDTKIAKVSIVGSGMVGQPGVAAKMFAALAKDKINIQMITTSEIKISCVVDEEQGAIALKAVHGAFTLAGEEKITIPA
ncbi:MAG: ACT domain-containing protein, partial [Spirulinaceae cyanobacterium]